MPTSRSFLLILLAITPAAAEEFSAPQLRFFETQVRPVFVEHCIKCHGPEKQWSNFRVDSRRAAPGGG